MVNINLVQITAPLALTGYNKETITVEAFVNEGQTFEELVTELRQEIAKVQSDDMNKLNDQRWELKRDIENLTIQLEQLIKIWNETVSFAHDNGADISAYLPDLQTLLTKETASKLLS